ncbi:MAG: antitoxin family protein [Gemmataceae bacterium]|nr:antitoxin family protein [Gemmataceae bacterium]
MPITVEAIYENGVLKPAQLLPLKEREKVQITVQTAVDLVRRTAGSWIHADPELIDKIATDPELDFPCREGS